MGYEEYRQRVESVCGRRNRDTAFRHLKDGEIRCFSYADVLACCRSFEKVIRQYGLRKGDRIAIAGYATFRCRLLIFAASYWNITVVLPDASLPAEVLLSQITECECRLVLTDRKFHGEKLGKLTLTALDAETDLYELIHDAGTCPEFPDRYPDVCTIVFSSGTGGRHNPVMITYDSCLTAVAFNSDQAKVAEKSSFLQVFPYYHISGFICEFVYFFRGKEICTVEKYEPEKTVEYLTLFSPTEFGMIPKVLETMISAMENRIAVKGGALQRYYNMAGSISEFFLRRFHVSFVGKLLFRPFVTKVFGKNIRGLLAGGMRSPLSLAMKVRKLGLIWFNSYSSTECNCPIVVTGKGDDYDRSSEGRVDWNDKIRIRIADWDAEGIGEVRVKTPLIMKGYFHQDEFTAAAFDENGFYRTGDLGYVDEKNYLHLVGRLGDVIRLQNGEKTTVAFLESLFLDGTAEDDPVFLCWHPSTDGAYDEITAVFRDLSRSEPEKEAVAETFLSHVRTRGAYPLRKVCFVEDIPVTSVGKVQRAALAEMAEKEKAYGVKKTERKPAETIFDFFLDLLEEHLGPAAITEEKGRLRDTGLDSLTVFCIAEKIRERFDVDIIPSLRPEMTFSELRQALSAPEKEHREVAMRKIRRNEVREAARLYGACMEDYPLYMALYPNNRRRKHQLVYDAWFVLYQQRNYTYINEEKTALFSIKRPGDRNRNVFWLHLNPLYLFGALRWFSVTSLRRIGSYLRFEESIRNKYYDPKTHDYVCNVCITKDKRSGSLFFDLIRQFDSGRPVYSETHSPYDLALYQKLGAELKETATWNQLPYYALVTNL